ncbi:U-box domain-containing protein 21-like [Phoenix dactylifera]|uniref:U-box domain-containing protein n=1 Tax=Phoenix dactylifera TaxID=42345 RepID=A0A8B7CFZ0_PHODC|nr:U-box domain-containing protein 21-like [Phoenix dactylifera]
MASTWRTRKADQKTNLAKRRSPNIAEVSIPTHFRCPISLELMKDPVTVSTGITYDRQSIETWLDMGNTTCPVTNQDLEVEDLIPNHSIRRMIQDWCVANHSYGIERIPTPKIPVTPAQASEILSGIAAASRRGETTKCRELAVKVKAFAKESERNRRCFMSHGAGRALAASFSAFAAGPLENSKTGVLEDILSALVFMHPLDEETAWHIGSPESLDSIVLILKCGDLAGRLGAVLVVKELVSANGEWVEVMANTKGLIEALVKLIKEPIFPQATKASLVATYYMVNSDVERMASRFVDLGLVPVLLEILVDSEKSMCEKALAVLSGLLSCEEGREKAYEHALTMPVLVKKMFRVSDMATEFVVSALWKLCKNYNEEEAEEGGRRGESLVEALQVGAFQKLLLLLQVGCSGSAKEKATDLLKLLNGYRGRAECIDTMDFKGLKRPF